MCDAGAYKDIILYAMHSIIITTIFTIAYFYIFTITTLA